MNIDTNKYMPVSEVLARLGKDPKNRIRVYQLMAAGIVRTIKPWRQPLLVEINSVRKHFKDFDATNSDNSGS
jgi:hypothetical protein